MRGFKPSLNKVSAVLAIFFSVIASVRAIDFNDLGIFEKLSYGRANSTEFLVIGHRGSPYKHPGNTIESFKAALKQGANALELDLCLTSDNRIVVWHDYCHSTAVAFVRETGHEGLPFRPWVPNLLSSLRRPTYEISLADFKKNYGYTKASSNRLGFVQRLPYAVPSFREFIDWAHGTNVKKVFLDVKIPEEPTDLAARFASRAARVLKDAEMADRAVFMCTSLPVLKAIRQKFAGTGAAFTFDQEVPVGFPSASKYSAVRPSPEGCSYVSIGKPRLAYDAWGKYQAIVQADMRRVGDRKFIAWTIDDPKELKWLIKAGVHGIVTNRPGLLADIAGSSR